MPITRVMVTRVGRALSSDRQVGHLYNIFCWLHLDK